MFHKVASSDLYSLHSSSLKPHNKNINYIKYADDITVVCYCRNADDDVLNEELNHVLEWAQSTQMVINSSKSKVMNICSRNTIQPIDIIHGDTFIQEVEKGKVLGVTVLYVAPQS